MTDSGKQKVPASNRVASLSRAEAEAALATLDGWSLQGDTIAKTFHFQDYHRTMAFVNAVAWIAHRADHHPDMKVGYNECDVRYTTHSAGGLSHKDFACAAEVDRLFSE